MVLPYITKNKTLYVHLPGSGHMLGWKQVLIRAHIRQGKNCRVGDILKEKYLRLSNFNPVD